MRLSPGPVTAWARTPAGRRKLQYSLASVISVVVGQAVVAFTFGILRWSARWSNVFAFFVAAVPSYQLNRAWVWRRSGRSDVRREVVPFIVIAAAGLAASTWAVELVERHTADVGSHAQRTALVMAASFAAVGVVWVVKFLLYDHLLFPSGREAEQRP